MADRQTAAMGVARPGPGVVVTLTQSVPTEVLEGRRAQYVWRLLVRTGIRRTSDATCPEDILAAYQVLHERGELLGEELH